MNTIVTPQYRLRAGAFIVFICFLLSLRPIPSVFSSNDTARHLKGVVEFKYNDIDLLSLDRQFSLSIYYALLQPVLWFSITSFVLFQAAVYIGIPLVVLMRNDRCSWLWGLSFTISVHGLELMTNALRQNLAMAIFLFGIYYLSRSMFKFLLLSVFAAAVHESVIPYAVAILFVNGVFLIGDDHRFLKNFVRVSFGLVTTIFVFRVIILGNNQWLVDLDNNKYSDRNSFYFDLFMFLPAFVCYSIRFILDRKEGVVLDTQIFVATILVSAVCAIYFPYILYRFSIAAATLQFFAAMIAPKRRTLSGLLACVFSVLHTFAFELSAGYYSKLFLQPD